MINIKTKKGKSRKVYLYDNYVVKEPLNLEISNDDILYYIVMGHYGEIENIKEFYFYKIIKKIPIFHDVFAQILDFDFDTTVIKAERLSLVSQDEFYNKVFNLYIKLSRYSLTNQRILDNHTVDNHENYGIDSNGNLKLLDYGIYTTIILDAYSLDLEDIKDITKLKELCDRITLDIKNNNFTKKINLRELLPLVLTLKYYKNPFKFYYYSYKYKLLDLKSIYNMILDKN